MRPLDGAIITRVESVRIDDGATYDLLPDSDTGTYFAAGTLVGSTLGPDRDACGGAPASGASR